MNNTVEKYKNGSRMARDILIDNILEEYDYEITWDEAKILLYKRYGDQRQYIFDAILKLDSILFSCYFFIKCIICGRNLNSIGRSNIVGVCSCCINDSLTYTP